MGGGKGECKVSEKYFLSSGFVVPVLILSLLCLLSYLIFLCFLTVSACSSSLVMCRYHFTFMLPHRCLCHQVTMWSSFCESSCGLQVTMNKNNMEISFPHQVFIDNEFMDASNGATYDSVNPTDESVRCWWIEFFFCHKLPCKCPPPSAQISPFSRGWVFIGIFALYRNPLSHPAVSLYSTR